MTSFDTGEVSLLTNPVEADIVQSLMFGTDSISVKLVLEKGGAQAAPACIKIEHVYNGSHLIFVDVGIGLRCKANQWQWHVS